MPTDMPFDKLLELASFALQFGRVRRATFHPDGELHETDTDHTVMLALVAGALLDHIPHPAMKRGRVLEFALVHDLVEAEVGDVDSFNLSPEARAAKVAREDEGRAAIARRFGPWFPWISLTMEQYEEQIEPEARFVRFVDKVLPKYTQTLNGGAQFWRMGRSLESVRHAHRQQLVTLMHEYPEFAGDTMRVLMRAMDDCEAAYVAAGVRHG